VTRARSVLAVPGSNQRMIDKAIASAADIAFLDLEDAVAPNAKDDARGRVAAAIAELDWQGKPRAFRVNGLDTAHCYRDLVEVVETAGNRVDLIIVPKVQSAGDVAFVSRLLDQIELRVGRTTPISLDIQIESAAGLLHAEAIAACDPRVVSITFGPGDFAASVGMPSEQIGIPGAWDQIYGSHRWHFAMTAIMLAGRAAGIRVVDGPYADFRDPDGLRHSARTARALGFDGKWCIHPDQIEIVNDVFAPSEAEIAHARRVVDAYEAAMNEGRGAITLDGKMVDAASIRMAERTLASA
jgi:citrate lyase subunit beta/citryl-CoA lyase